MEEGTTPQTDETQIKPAGIAEATLLICALTRAIRKEETEGSEGSWHPSDRTAQGQNGSAKLAGGCRRARAKTFLRKRARLVWQRTQCNPTVSQSS